MSTDAPNLSKLRWRCRRGMRELDEAMLAYLDNHYEHASSDERAIFEQLQELQDPELFKLVSGKAREARYQIVLDKITATLGGRT
ncbi:MAG: succinate dehydrogenase assembly factor 2 [Granulosicoccus sp.]